MNDISPCVCWKMQLSIARIECLQCDGFIFVE